MRIKTHVMSCAVALILSQPAHSDGAAASGFLHGLNSSPMGNMPALMMQREQLRAKRETREALAKEETFRKRLGEIYINQGLGAAKRFAIQEGRFEYVQLLNDLPEISPGSGSNKTARTSSGGCWQNGRYEVPC